MLAANKNYYEIKRQIIRYKPKNFLIYDFKIYKKIKKENKNKKIKIINTIKDFKPKKKIDITITAIPGIAGLAPTLTTIKLSKKILIANKESIICGWNLIDRNAKKYKTKIIPMNSEHFSILKLIKNQNLDEIKKIYLTASGGPFLNLKKRK